MIILILPVTIVVGAGAEKKRGLAPRRLMDCLLPPSTRHALTIARMIHMLYKHRRADEEAAFCQMRKISTDH